MSWIVTLSPSVRSKDDVAIGRCLDWKKGWPGLKAWSRTLCHLAEIWFCCCLLTMRRPVNRLRSFAQGRSTTSSAAWLYFKLYSACPSHFQHNLGSEHCDAAIVCPRWSRRGATRTATLTTTVGVGYFGVPSVWKTAQTLLTFPAQLICDTMTLDRLKNGCKQPGYKMTKVQIDRGSKTWV